MLVFLCIYCHAKNKDSKLHFNKQKLHTRFCSTIYKITSVISQKKGYKKFPSPVKLRHLPMRERGLCLALSIFNVQH